MAQIGLLAACLSARGLGITGIGIAAGMAPGIMGAAGTGGASAATGIAAGSFTVTADFMAEAGSAAKADFMEVEDSTVAEACMVEAAFTEAATEAIVKEFGL
jgi:hypothetical protein